MFYDILMPVLTLSGIAIGAGYMLTELGKASSNKYDERQLIERGRGANLAMATALMYMLGIYVGHAFDLLRPEHGSIFAVYGLTVMIGVSDGYCIFHDAYLCRGESLGMRVLNDTLLGVLWLSTALRRGAWDMEAAWINGALALSWLSRGVMLLLRAAVLRIQDRLAAKEEADGEE